MRKGGEVLTENVVFIILNLIFIAILILFVVSNTGKGAFLEERYAKQIALLIDAAKPNTIMKLNVEDALNEAKRNNYNGKIISVEGNKVYVNIKGKQGNSYSFFNNVDVTAYPDSSEKIKSYIIEVNDYK